MKTQITIILTKITWVLFLAISISQWSCVEDINPREIAPSERFSPPQENCVQPNPIIETPDSSKNPEKSPNSRGLGD